MSISAQKIIVYGSPVCAMVPPVRRTLERANVDFEYIDIYFSEEARTRISEINSGYQSVPTLVFPDGSTLTEPSILELTTKLEILGYEVQPLTWLDQLQLILTSPTIRLFGIIFLVLGITGGNNLLLAIGGALLVLGMLMSWLNRQRHC